MKLAPISFRQIVADHGHLYALASDGTVYRYIPESWEDVSAESEGRKSKRPAEAHWFPLTTRALNRE